jgi:hypothetical protein
MEQDSPKILPIEERDTYDLFKDQGISSILSKIPKDQLSEGHKKGSYIYSLDYDKITGESKKCMDTLTFIHEGMKSGLRPSQLDPEEVDTMRSTYGEKWYEQYGHTSEKD